MSKKQQLLEKLWEIVLAVLGVISSKTFLAGMTTAYAYYEATGDLRGVLVAVGGYVIKNISADFGKSSAKIQKRG